MTNSIGAPELLRIPLTNSLVTRNSPTNSARHEAPSGVLFNDVTDLVVEEDIVPIG